jgi:hypothetical protein
MPFLLHGIYKVLHIYKWVYIHYFIIALPQGENAITIEKNSSRFVDESYRGQEIT